MLSVPPTVRVFVVLASFDMRGSFDALARAVRRLEMDPVNGHLYLFLNKRRRLAKAIWFDGSGWLVEATRARKLSAPRFEGDVSQVAIDGTAFAALLAGIDFTAARRGWHRRGALTEAHAGIDADSLDEAKRGLKRVRAQFGKQLPRGGRVP